MEDRLSSTQFPLSSRYHPDWLIAGASGGANPLWLTEWLAAALELKPGMRVLDLSCGRALSSIFLHREFGVQVWAVDLWFSVDENLQRSRDAGAENGVFPVHADARSLPFAPGFFDVITCIDSYPYYGTDDLYLGALARFLKPDGWLGIAGAGLVHEIEEAVPAHLREWWTPDLCCLHSAAWWRRHWERSGIVDVQTADTLPEGWRWWRDWQLVVAPDNTPELRALEADHGQYLGYVRVVARRRPGVPLQEPSPSFPPHYTKTPLFRGQR
jgi:SAM-dependent methyltransferase